MQATLNRLIVQKAITQLTHELNPYGLAKIVKSVGNLKKGNLLTTQWNDPDNNPGKVWVPEGWRNNHLSL